MQSLTDNEREFIRRMPKVELHVHLEGSVYPETLLQLAARHGRELPIGDASEAADWFVFRDFPHFIEIYLEICNCLRDEDDYAFVTVEMARRAAAENLRYMEITFAPTSMLNPRTPALPDVVMPGLRAGAAIAARDHGVEMQFIFDPVRGRTVEEVMASARWWTENGGDRLVGFGLGGLELGHPASRYAEAFELASAAGARISLHAGETDGPLSVRDALVTGAERIGHGVRAIEDAELVTQLAESKMLLEISPTSNIRLGVYPSYADHPFKRLAEAGVLVTVNSDDPPMFGTTLTREFEVLAEHFGYTLDELVQFTRNAVQGAFLPASSRETMEREIIAETAMLANEFGVALPSLSDHGAS